jgi:hypothetical protein
VNFGLQQDDVPGGWTSDRGNRMRMAHQEEVAAAGSKAPPAHTRHCRHKPSTRHCARLGCFTASAMLPASESLMSMEWVARRTRCSVSEATTGSSWCQDWPTLTLSMCLTYLDNCQQYRLNSELHKEELLTTQLRQLQAVLR